MRPAPRDFILLRSDAIAIRAVKERGGEGGGEEEEMLREAEGS
jgi:hypothetical protein